MKLELKHLAGYLPYELKAMDKRTKEIRIVTLLHFTYNKETVGHNHLLYKGLLLSEHLPILRPLSDLTKEIEVNGEKFVPMKKLLKEVGFNYPLECYIQDEQWILNDGYRAIGQLSHRKVDMLLQWHFDIYGLIENNLAIDKNTLK